ncbi:MAG TPA: phosphopentomutase [Bacillota bacterium]|nr:phosphopentomutase [Bacillota bacterium]
MEMFHRVFLIVLDSVGIGQAPDAANYGDEGAHTLENIAKATSGLHLPHMGSLGLSNIEAITGVEQTDQPTGIYTKMQEASVGKDTMTGHWELMGLRIDEAFQTFPEGFPADLIQALERETGRKVIGNKPASGTVILDELGKEHMETGAIIVYTSADSVLQIAAHESIVSIEELYDICEKARALTMQPPYMVGRVIARPFIGEEGAFIRTSNRHDYALKPFSKTVLDTLKQADFDVISLGKIADIFDNEGITDAVRTVSNNDGVEKLLETMDRSFTGLCFLNLVDFDAVYGHRRDPEGYAQALEEFDQQLPSIIEKLRSDDLLMITADHGNDPTHHGTDHTREFVPLLIHHSSIEKGYELPLRQTFSDVGATIADNFNVKLPMHGKSFLRELVKGDK